MNITMTTTKLAIHFIVILYCNTHRCYEELKNLGVRAMVAEIKLGLATNIIFTTIVVSLLP